MTKWTSKDVIELLKAKYPSPRYVTFEELRYGTGYNTRKKKNIESRIDFWCLDTYPSKKHHKISFEIKISKQDFLLDIKKVNKQEAALLISNELYYIAPAGIIPVELVPDFAGLIEITATKRFKIIKKAPSRDVKDAEWVFVSSLGRRINKNQILNLKDISDGILSEFLTILRNKGIKTLSPSDFALFNLLNLERIRRTASNYNKSNKDSRQYSNFMWMLRKSYPYITDKKAKELWENIKINKFRTKKRRLKYIDETLTEMEKKEYKSYIDL